MWTEIAAIALSPIIAVLVSICIQNRKEARNHKYWILTTLISNRETPLTIENVRALNMIDITFHKSKNVRKVWKELFDLYNNPSMNSELGGKQRKTKNLELIVEIAKELGYKKTITAFDADRIYIPQGLAEQMEKNNQLIDELLRVLRASGGVQFLPRDQKN
jgi:hypothetical protein